MVQYKKNNQGSERLLELKVKLLRDGAILPKYNSDGACSLDLYACTDHKIIVWKWPALIPTGISIEIPKGYYGQIRDRSSMFVHNRTHVGAGIIDEDFRGEILVAIVSLGDTYTIKDGDRIAQLTIQKYEHVDVIEIKELSDTIRGKGGFGSTGK